jgi:predicted membrane-bound spermidine synthase
MTRKFWFLYLLLLVEGASLMAVELMGAKFLAPFYGSSLYVWTAVLTITVLGLTAGYYLGGRLAAKHASENRLVLILCIASILVIALPVTASASISITSRMGLIIGICIACLLLPAPPMLCFGLVGPLAVRLMAQNRETVGNVAGTVYFASTIGGIAATFLFGFHWIPELGLKSSAMITGLALGLLPALYAIKTSLSSEKSEMLPAELAAPRPAKISAPARKGVKTPLPKTSQIKRSVYLFAAVEGATVMAVELMAARMLAPYFGASLYVWVAVIGITLLSLALGYYAGGRLADKYPRIETIHWVFLISATFLLLMHFTSQRLTLAFAGMDMRIAVVLVSFLLVLPPLLFLGMAPTMLIRYVTAEADRAGAATGRVFTISSASGIVALPVMGFLVIPQFGLTGPSILIGMAVGTVPFLKLLSQKKYAALLFVVFLLFSLSQRNVPASSANVKILTYSEGLLGQVLVADVSKTAAGNPANDRVLFVNRMGQTIFDTYTGDARLSYVPFAASAASKLPANAKALLLGLGGGSMANVLQNGLKLSVDAVELDGRIVKAAQAYFYLNPKVRVIIDDARHYLETTGQTYDLIFFDVFKGDIPPPHVLSLECFRKAKSLLNKDGLIIVNFNGFLSDKIGAPGRSVYATLRAAGLETRILPTPGVENERNTLFLASLNVHDFQTLRSPLLQGGQPVALASLFLNPDALNLQDATVFTDDKPNLDRMNLEAANLWRKDYNATYTAHFLNHGIPLFR